MTSDKLKLISGAGGGGGGGGDSGGGSAPDPPYIQPDNLQSIQYATIVDLISEGEIDGIENGLKGIYLDGTPVLSSAGTPNFRSYTIDTRNGTQDQSTIPGATVIESEQSVNAEIFNGAPLTRTLTSTLVDRVRVTITLPQLQRFQTDGDVRGTSVSLSIQVQYNGGGFNTVKNVSISGKSSSTYQRDAVFDINGEFPVDIRVIRNTANASTTVSNRTTWTSFTEIITEKLRYPNSALAYLRFNSKQFSSIPARKYLVRGVKVKIPSNATVDTTTYPGRITYTGIWDGTFSTPTWTNDPAWCLWDLLTNNRYGAGVPESSLDRYDFYSISQYCRELVNNGKGGLEPRFACNLLINSRQEVYNVIQEMTSIFRGISYYGAGSLVLQQDKPSDPQYLIGPSNVVNGAFNYSGSALKSRHTTATVAWQDYDTLGEVQFEYVEDADAVSKYGVVNKDIKAAGCYSQGQAKRLGKWTLLSEQNLTETVTFSIGIDSGIVLRPGMVIDIADPVRAGSRRSGRVSSATSLAITVDSTSDLSVDLTKSPTLSVVLPTGLVETRPIASISSTTVTVTSAFSEAPNPESVWLIQTTDIQSQLFRVIGVTEGEDGSFAVTALKYNESIYAAIEENLEVEERDITNLSNQPGAATSVSLEEFLYLDGSNVRTGVTLSWVGPGLNVDYYIVKYRLDDDNFTIISTSSPSTEIRGLKAGTLELEITALSPLGRQGTTTSATFALAGKTAPPGDVQNLTIETISANSARLRWDATTDLDVQVGGKVIIRHSSLIDGTGTWSNSVSLVPAVAGAATEAIVPRIEGEILVKFEDSLGIRSPNATSVLVDLPDTLNTLLVQERREDQDVPPFQGTKVNCFFDESLNALVVGGSGLLDDQPDVDLITTLDYLGTVSEIATYEFANTLDLEAVYSLDLERHLVSTGFYPGDLIDSRLELIDAWNEFDGGVIDQINAKIYMRKTDDDPAGTPTWGAWQEFVAGTFIGRAFQFKAELLSFNESQGIQINELGYKATFQQRTEQSPATIASGAGAKNVSFVYDYFTGTAVLGGVDSSLPSVGITAQSLQSGDFLELTNVSSTGFTATFKDSGGTAVDRNFTYTASGYGRGS